MARYYKGKRIGANVYTQGKFGKGLREIVDTDNPLLYSDGIYPTKLTAADLPEDYIKIHSRVIWYMKGYLRTSGIVDMMYRWVRENHLFKDDYIYISYHGPLRILKIMMSVSAVMISSISFLRQKGIRALILQRSGLKLKRKESGFGTMNRIIIKNVDLKTETYSSSG